jgi:hypothetical protein
MDNNYYVLDGHNAKPVKDVLEWGKYFDKSDRTVKKTTVGEAKVSTVFLGLNHRFGEGEPLLFETMIFGGKEDGWRKRYSTWDEAVKGHDTACEMLVAK